MYQNTGSKLCSKCLGNTCGLLNEEEERMSKERVRERKGEVGFEKMNLRLP